MRYPNLSGDSAADFLTSQLAASQAAHVPASQAADAGTAPWNRMPRTGRPFRAAQSRTVQSPQSGSPSADLVVVRYAIPSGLVGVIDRYRFAFAGTGYDGLTTALRFGLLVDGAAPPGYGSMTDQTGSMTQMEPFGGTIICQPGQVIESHAYLETGGDLNGTLAAGFAGWLYPA